ncbi:glycosyltransferase involved in cell wall biosynthesis [Labrenzia sp. EL_208]|nr:glycosyltransferase involved in cell wall biosynthesis [Labrenzia sp. EL_132]MBG6231223.1 glycosyltransferase involved in cell wall biosynthesis [Labrenzia sp. EL_208]
MKIAFVKQDVYQDLYVCPAGTKDAHALLFSSMMRVGPVGLFTELDTSFYIVDEDPAPECQIYRSVIPKIADDVKLLKTKTIEHLPGEEFKRPGSPYPNGHFSVPCRSIDWSDFDVVISINVSIPKDVIRQHPQVLFCYMIGEANLASKWAEFGYDVCLNQLISNNITSKIGGAVDFPYTFVGPHCLENLLRQELGRGSLQDGVYAEINMSSERPVQSPPDELKPLVDDGYRVRIHKQNIKENLQELYDAKYFVKLGGRLIRGNSVIEAVSCGTLVLLPRDTLIHEELIPEGCSVENLEELTEKVRYLDDNPLEYERLLNLQRDVVLKMCFENAVTSLERCLQDKRKIMSKGYFLSQALQRKRRASVKTDLFLAKTATRFRKKYSRVRRALNLN